MTIRELQSGESAKVLAVGGSGSLRQHLLDMGVIPGVIVKHIKTAPMGDPVEIMIHGYSLTLRLEEASLIEVADPDPEEDITANDGDSNQAYISSLHEHNSHPGYGEAGKYHSKEDENPLPKGKALTFALVGQHNSGKTSLFNKLTGKNRHVGNYPGVTVDCQDGEIAGIRGAVVTDLPGIYSLSTYTEGEMVARRFIIDEKPAALINIVDAGNIERNLYLTMQLMELGIPMVIALNMMDELHSNGGSVRVNEMEKILGVPVVPITAATGEGVSELIEHAVHIAKYQERPAYQDFCGKDDYNGAVHRCLHAIMHLVEDHAQAAGLPLRFVASRLVEGDQDVLERLGLSENEKDMLEHIILQLEKERGLDRCAAMADMRFSFINRLCAQAVAKPGESRQHKLSGKMDRILTGKWTAIPVFVTIISLVIWLTIDVIGAWLQKLLADGIGYVSSLVDSAFLHWDVSDAVRSLVIDAIFGGVGSVVSFVPIIVVLFFFLSLLEDSGYMARIAFVSDKLLRKVGLSGRSIVPLLIGFGCSVPAVMATRTLPSAKDRKLTVLLIPFMSCSGKLAIYAFLSAAFFPGYGGLVLIGLYLLGILAGAAVALARKLLRRNYEPSPFVMELPVYRWPSLKNLWHLIWDKTRDFLQQAFTIIFIATIVIWFLQTFDFRLNMVGDAKDSMLAAVAGVLTPLFVPTGLGDWRIVSALISGFMGKENIVATLQVLGAGSVLTATTAVPMLVFCLLYTPCVAAVASVRRESGTGTALFMVVFQCVLAWICSWIAYQIVL